MAAISNQLKYKFGFIAAVIVACVIGIFCISTSGLSFPTSLTKLKDNLNHRIRLGLDLNGGSHLVVQVQLQDAVRQNADQAVDTIKNQARAQNISIGEVSEDPSYTQVVVHDVDPNATGRFRDIVTNQLPGWTLSSLAGENNGYVLAYPPSALADLRSRTMEDAIETITRRVDALGTTEPKIASTGRAQDEILIELPGEGDPTRAKAVISEGGQLELTLLADAQPYASEAEALAAHNGVLPAGTEIVPGLPDAANGQTNGSSSTVYYVVQRAPIVTGRDLESATPTPSTKYPGKYVVSFVLSNVGASRFGPATAENVGKYLAIVLDGKVQLAAVIEERMDNSGQIEGNFSQQDAQDLAVVLRSGALPASIKYLEEERIGASLGSDSIRDGVRASIGSIIVVMIFLVIYYRLAGVNAVVALFLNLVILIAGMTYFGFVFTLPGIAGVILTIGMGVDSNVLVFERIREELRNGKAPASAVDVGFEKAFLTIIDTHVTTVVSAIFLLLFGTGPVQGFAITLTIGLVANLFTSIYVSRAIFDLHLAHMRRDEPLSV
ncbi:MAG TPA: protein translocase subunit SecD [Candidatus Acidoferrales bacterium]|nr:protein translocase subunit SecD [Candidatus Acidoferrales bacterium]